MLNDTVLEKFKTSLRGDLIQRNDPRYEEARKLGENYKRLAAVKAKYDSKNLFRVNQNIKPAVS